MEKNVSVEFPCEFSIDEECGAVVATCRSLNLFSQGSDEEEARAAIAEAISMYLERKAR